MSAHAIAIVGLACRYPDAPDLQSFWDLVRGGWLAFRRIPPGRLDLGDFLDADGGAPHTVYCTRAALIEGWELDHAAYQASGGTRSQVDPAHLLALDTAARALRDAGFPGGHGLDRQRAGVMIGQTGTSDMRRAATLRLYWPRIRGALATALTTVAASPTGDPTGEWRNAVLETAAKCFITSLPEVTAGTLADGPAGSIAGRICAHFDFQGGGHAVDATCSSSLIAVVAACAALATGDLDFALAGGVDIGLDPFDLVAFARAGALATNEMRIYDAAPTGFLLGEGCGIVALMRARDAHAAGVPVYADITGWGVSSAGNSRPSSADGLLLALRRAYQRAETDPAHVQLFEGHAAGTAASDLAELTALTALRADAPQPAALGSIKANIGHPRAAAGVAGLLKAVLAMSAGTLPPTTGCKQPHPLLRAAGSTIRVLAGAQPWPDGQRLAGVSTMGFSGTNAHVVLCRSEDHGGRGAGRNQRRRRRPVLGLTNW